MLAAARSVGQQIIVLSAGTAEEIDGGLANLARQRAGGFSSMPILLFQPARSDRRARGAATGTSGRAISPDFTAAGGLMTYADDRPESLRQAYIYVGRILKARKRAICRCCGRQNSELISTSKPPRNSASTVPATLIARATRYR